MCHRNHFSVGVDLMLSRGHINFYQCNILVRVYFPRLDNVNLWALIIRLYAYASVAPRTDVLITTCLGILSPCPDRLLWCGPFLRRAWD